jgi:hypothetical protein
MWALSLEEELLKTASVNLGTDLPKFCASFILPIRALSMELDRAILIPNNDVQGNRYI